MEFTIAVLAVLLAVETAALVAFVAYSSNERKDLLNRIMANDWATYHAGQAATDSSVSTVDDSRERALAEAWLAEERAKREVLAHEAEAGIELEFV